MLRNTSHLLLIVSFFFSTTLMSAEQGGWVYPAGTSFQLTHPTIVMPTGEGFSLVPYVPHYTPPIFSELQSYQHPAPIMPNFMALSLNSSPAAKGQTVIDVGHLKVDLTKAINSVRKHVDRNNPSILETLKQWGHLVFFSGQTINGNSACGAAHTLHTPENFRSLTFFGLSHNEDGTTAIVPFDERDSYNYFTELMRYQEPSSSRFSDIQNMGKIFLNELSKNNVTSPCQPAVLPTQTQAPHSALDISSGDSDNPQTPSDTASTTSDSGCTSDKQIVGNSLARSVTPAPITPSETPLLTTTATLPVTPTSSTATTAVVIEKKKEKQPTPSTQISYAQVVQKKLKEPTGQKKQPKKQADAPSTEILHSKKSTPQPDSDGFVAATSTCMPRVDPKVIAAQKALFDPSTSSSTTSDNKKNKEKDKEPKKNPPKKKKDQVRLSIQPTTLSAADLAVVLSQTTTLDQLQREWVSLEVYSGSMSLWNDLNEVKRSNLDPQEYSAAILRIAQTKTPELSVFCDNLLQNPDRYKITFKDKEHNQEYNTRLSQLVAYVISTGHIDDEKKCRHLIKTFKEFCPTLEADILNGSTSHALHAAIAGQKDMYELQASPEDFKQQFLYCPQDKLKADPSLDVLQIAVDHCRTSITSQDLPALSKRVPFPTGVSEEEQQMRNSLFGIYMRATAKNPTAASLDKLYDICVQHSGHTDATHPEFETLLLFFQGVKIHHTTAQLRAIAQDVFRKFDLSLSDDLSPSQQLNSALSTQLHNHLTGIENSEALHTALKNTVTKCINSPDGIKDVQKSWSQFCALTSELLSGQTGVTMLRATARTIFDQLDPDQSQELYHTLRLAADEKGKKKSKKYLQDSMIKLFANYEIPCEQKNSQLRALIHQLSLFLPDDEVNTAVANLYTTIVKAENEHHTQKDNPLSSKGAKYSHFLTNAVANQESTTHPWRNGYNVSFNFAYPSFIVDPEQRKEKVQLLQEELLTSDPKELHHTAHLIACTLHSILDYMNTHKQVIELSKKGPYKDIDQAYEATKETIQKLFSMLPIDIQTLDMELNKELYTEHNIHINS